MSDYVQFTQYAYLLGLAVLAAIWFTTIGYDMWRKRDEIPLKKVGKHIAEVVVFAIVGTVLFVMVAITIGSILLLLYEAVMALV